MSRQARLGPERSLRILREGLLWAFAALGALCIAAAIAAITFGATPLIFRSGSMSPAIPTGSLAIAVSTPANKLVPGDIVSVVWADGTRVSHRLVSATPSDDLFTLRTQGDANDVADTEQVTVARADRIVWHVPQLGFVLEEAMKPQYVFGVGVLVGGLVIIAFRASPRPSGRRRAGPVAGGALSLILIGGLLLAPAPTSTMAAFVNQGTARGTFAAGTLNAPTNLQCNITGAALAAKTINLAWTAPATGVTPTGYVVAWTPLLVGNTGSQVVTGTSIALSPTLLTLAVTYTLSVTAIAGTKWNSTSISRNVLATTSLLVACL